VIRSELDTIDHVLRGVLNTALLNLQLLATTVDSEGPGGPLVERTRAEIRRLAELLWPAALDILALEIKRIEQVDLRRLTTAALAERDVNQVVLAPGPSPSVEADPDLLRLALAHLARNAVAATPEQGPAPRIDIDVEPNQAAMRVTNACREGVPPVTAGSIPGRRGHLGGLMVVTRIARLHGGRLTYEATEGELVARLTIPERSLGIVTQATSA
jgi:signal transduction histidine kinase